MTLAGFLSFLPWISFESIISCGDYGLFKIPIVPLENGELGAGEMLSE